MTKAPDKLSCLIIDDLSDMSGLAEYHLKELGAKVTVVNNMHDAKTLITGHSMDNPFNLIILGGHAELEREGLEFFGKARTSHTASAKGVGAHLRNSVIVLNTGNETIHHPINNPVVPKGFDHVLFQMHGPRLRDRIAEFVVLAHAKKATPIEQDGAKHGR